MSAANWDRAFSLTLKHEGGFVNHPRDPGGATNLGVTIGTLSKWLGRRATVGEVKALRPIDVKPIYDLEYWDKIRGDELPPGVDYALYDFAVNSGPARAVIQLQRIVGVADDGKLGPLTMKAVKKMDPKVLIARICADRLAFVSRLSGWPVFGRGWRKRIQGVESEALKMAA